MPVVYPSGVNEVSPIVWSSAAPSLMVRVRRFERVSTGGRAETLFAVHAKHSGISQMGIRLPNRRQDFFTLTVRLHLGFVERDRSDAAMARVVDFKAARSADEASAVDLP